MDSVCGLDVARGELGGAWGGELARRKADARKVEGWRGAADTKA